MLRFVRAALTRFSRWGRAGLVGHLPGIPLDHHGVKRFSTQARRHLENGPGLDHFLRLRFGATPAGPDVLPLAVPLRGTVYIETHGCAMNESDSATLLSVLQAHGWQQTNDLSTATAALLNTCAIRDAAEARVLSRLAELRALRRERGDARQQILGVLGCVAERLKGRLFDVVKVKGGGSSRMADLVAGPDAYRDVPRMLEAACAPSADGHGQLNVELSSTETYADIAPARAEGAVSALVSIQRGCDNACTFCIVPRVRGRERSRPAATIVDDVVRLSAAGVREVTLLGQNVNSYADWSEAMGGEPPRRRPADDAVDPFSAYAPGFTSVYRPRRDGSVSFADLLGRVADAAPETRVRFTSPHPKDFGPDVLDVMASRPNICKAVHLPLQSGSDATLARMRRGYTRASYLDLVGRVRDRLPGVALSTDAIAGFCGESESDHGQTVSLLTGVAYESAFLFAYSRRERTPAARMEDDVPSDVKARRLGELIAAYRAGASARHAAQVGCTHLVLVEGPSRRSPEVDLTGRTDSGLRCHFAAAIVTGATGAEPLAPMRAGEYVALVVESSTGGALRGRALYRTTIAEFAARHGGKCWAPRPSD